MTLICNNCEFTKGSGDLWYCGKYGDDLYFAPDNELYKCDECLREEGVINGLAR